MSKDNHIYPSKDAVFKMYKYLTTYENTVAAHPGEFDLESKELQQFLVKQNIIIKPVSDAESDIYKKCSFNILIFNVL